MNEGIMLVLNELSELKDKLYDLIGANARFKSLRLKNVKFTPPENTESQIFNLSGRGYIKSLVFPSLSNSIRLKIIIDGDIVFNEHSDEYALKTESPYKDQLIISDIAFSTSFEIKVRKELPSGTYSNSNYPENMYILFSLN